MINFVFSLHPVFLHHTTTNKTNLQHNYPRFLSCSYPQGNVSTYLHSLTPGDTAQIRGPTGGFRLSKLPPTLTHVVFIAGGTGLTPCLQVLREFLSHPDPTYPTPHMTLVTCNSTPEDMLLEEFLEELAEGYGEMFDLHWVCSRARRGWVRKGSGAGQRWVGRMGVELLEDVWPENVGVGENVYVMYCGPPGFATAVKDTCAEMGLKRKQMHRF